MKSEEPSAAVDAGGRVALSLGQAVEGDMSERAGTFTRALAVLVVLVAFVVTKQINLPDVDWIAWIAVGLAGISAVVLGAFVYLDYQQDKAKYPIRPVASEVVRIIVIVSGGLLIFGIWRTVVVGVLDQINPQYTDPALGLSLILLLVAIFYMTRPAQPAPSQAPPTPADQRKVTGRDGGGGGDGGGAGSGSASREASGGVQTPAGGVAGAAVAAAQSLTRIGTIVALVVVIGYASFIWLLVQQVTLPDSQWSRLVDLRAGIESAAFAALGALIGVTIQGRTTDAAKAQATAASEAAEAAVAGQDEAQAIANMAQTEAAALVTKVKTAETGLTELERTMSDNALPSSVRPELQSLLVQEPQRFGALRLQDNTDEVITRIRAIRDSLRASS